MLTARLTGLYILVAFLLSACESENEHFCAKYSYYYKELTQSGILPYKDIKAQLQRELADVKKDHDQAKIALFVLEDIDNDIKPENEPAKAFCTRRKRWEQYR